MISNVKHSEYSIKRQDGDLNTNKSSLFKDNSINTTIIHKVTACAFLILLAIQGTFANQNIFPNQNSAIQNVLSNNALISSTDFSFQNKLVCPLSRIENMQLEANYLEKNYGQKFDIELFDNRLIEFQEGVINTLNSNNYYKPADSGQHRSPILFDSDTNEPIGIIKGQEGQWSVTCNIGDIIAYKLDQNQNGYLGVPPAFKISSFQNSNGEKLEAPLGTIVKWIPNTHQITSQELRTADLEQRQAIAIFDIRIGNPDRAFNILVGNNGELYPMDHDAILTKYIYPLTHTNYSEKPLTKKAKEYIRSIDINQDIKILRQHGIDEGEIDNLVIRTTFLKLAAEEKEVNLEYVENAIVWANLPTSARIERFFQNWIRINPSRKILSKLQEPYNEDQLKTAFRDTFQSYITAGKTWSYMNFLSRKFLNAIC